MKSGRNVVKYCGYVVGTWRYCRFS